MVACGGRIARKVLQQAMLACAGFRPPETLFLGHDNYDKNFVLGTAFGANRCFYPKAPALLF